MNNFLVTLSRKLSSSDKILIWMDCHGNNILLVLIKEWLRTLLCVLRKLDIKGYQNDANCSSRIYNFCGWIFNEFAVITALIFEIRLLETKHPMKLKVSFRQIIWIVTSKSWRCWLVNNTHIGFAPVFFISFIYYFGFFIRYHFSVVLLFVQLSLVVFSVIEFPLNDAFFVTS